MKNIIPTLLITVLSLSVFGQLPFPHTPLNVVRPHTAKAIDRAQIESLKGNRTQSNSGSRALQHIALDYFSVEEFETVQQNGTYESFIWDLNTNYDDQDTNRFALTWGVVRFDTITGLDASGNVVAYPRSSTSITIDSVEVFATHVNTHHTPDTIIISVYNWEGGNAGLQVNANEDIVNTVIYADTIITTTSLSPSATMLTALTIYPDTTLTYPNNRFLVGVHFYGDTTHTFTVLAGYGDRCGAACQAYTSIFELNSFWRMIAWNGTTDLTGINGIAYNCDGDGNVGEGEECEEFPIQDFAFTPWITINPVLSSSIKGGGTICPGDKDTLSVAPVGGTGPYDVKWTPTTGLSNPFSPTTEASPTTTTDYLATIIDSDPLNPDTITRTVRITVNAITINAGVDDSVNCGETTNLTATVGGVVAGGNFAWSNGVNTLNNPAVGPGCYEITATNSFGCSATDEVCVVIPGVNQVLNFNTGLANNLGCRDTTISFDNTSKNSVGWAWLWTFGDTLGNISTAKSPSYVYHATGSYTVTLSADSGGCSVASISKTLSINNCFNGIEESGLSKHIEMYPNPTTGSVTLNFSDLDGRSGVVEVYDLTGKLAVQEQVSVTGSMQKVLNLGKLADGVYFVKIQLGEDVAVRRLNVTR